jgi:hypothetical protein
VDPHDLGDLGTDPHGRVESGHRLLEDHRHISAAHRGEVAGFCGLPTT